MDMLIAANKVGGMLFAASWWILPFVVLTWISRRSRRRRRRDAEHSEEARPGATAGDPTSQSARGPDL